MRSLWLLLRAVLERLAGRETLDRWLDRAGFFRLKSRLLRSEKRLPDGNVIAFRPDDEKIIDEVYAHGAYSRPALADGDVVIDVGAHIGVFALYAAKRNPRGRVIAVEPAPLNLELLRENLSRNRAGNVVVHAIGLSDRPGEAKLYSRGDHSMYSMAESTAGPVYTVARVRTLDELAGSEGLSICHLLKIDVEKLELKVLEGAPKTLAITRQVIVEAEKEGAMHERVRALLEAAGFACEIVDDTGGGVVIFGKR